MFSARRFVTPPTPGYLNVSIPLASLFSALLQWIEMNASALAAFEMSHRC
nr:MAG TPA: hypothetical protein [Bacteriophage sp.]